MTKGDQFFSELQCPTLFFPSDDEELHERVPAPQTPRLYSTHLRQSGFEGFYEQGFPKMGDAIIERKNKKVLGL